MLAPAFLFKERKAIMENNNEKLFIGQSYEFSKVISDADVFNFAEVTGDKNPLHLDDDYAKTTIFKERIAHGMIGAGVISGAIGMHLPGPGTTYLGQELSFKQPIKINDRITVKIEVIEIIEKSKFNIVKLRTICLNPNGDVAIEGIATVIPPK